MSGWEDFDRVGMTLSREREERKRLQGAYNEALVVLTRLGAIARTVMYCRPNLDTDAQTAESIHKELRLAVTQWEAFSSQWEEEEAP